MNDCSGQILKPSDFVLNTFYNMIDPKNITKFYDKSENDIKSNPS